MMKRLLTILLLCCLLLCCALADGPRPFDSHYLTLSPEELAACMEAAMAAADLPGAKVCQYPDDSYAITGITEQDALCVARRTDGLLTLCCFVPEDGRMVLAWHNDLLLSHYQALTFGPEGAVWSGGLLPSVLLLQDNSNLLLRLDLMENIFLMLECDGFHSDWTILRIGVYTPAPDGTPVPLLVFSHRDLEELIRLSCCHPGNWLEQEEASW